MPMASSGITYHWSVDKSLIPSRARCDAGVGMAKILIFSWDIRQVCQEPIKSGSAYSKRSGCLGLIPASPGEGLSDTSRIQFPCRAAGRLLHFQFPEFHRKVLRSYNLASGLYKCEPNGALKLANIPRPGVTRHQAQGLLGKAGGFLTLFHGFIKEMLHQ